MDYHKIYIEIMERSADRIIDGYTEKHHIVPKCMGGDDKPRNIAILTPQEHYVAHQLLVKMYPKHRGLAYAAMLMATDGRGNRVNNKLYGWIQQRQRVKNSPEHNVNISKGRLAANIKLSPEHKQKLLAGTKGKTSHIKGKKVGLRGKFKSDGFLTMEDATEIRRLKTTGLTVSNIAKRFNVRYMVVYRIVNNKTYCE